MDGRERVVLLGALLLVGVVFAVTMVNYFNPPEQVWEAKIFAVYHTDENTLVFFSSDNGATGPGSNAPFSGHKSTLYEGGIRVPCIIRWPGVIPPGVVSHQPCITMDLTVSMASAAGVKPPRPFDGIDIVRHVASRAPSFPRTLFWRARRGQRTWRAVRDGDMKYLSLTDGEKFSEWVFDLAADPAEKQNLLKARPAEARRLKALLPDWERAVRHTRGRET